MEIKNPYWYKHLKPTGVPINVGPQIPNIDLPLPQEAKIVDTLPDVRNLKKFYNSPTADLELLFDTLNKSL